jgi:hypothetical protein
MPNYCSIYFSNIMIDAKLFYNEQFFQISEKLDDTTCDSLSIAI